MSLLTILGQGPSYGYRLRTEFERRTGGTWPLNVGQIYNTLERLERDGLVARAGSDEHGHVFYEITPAGALEVAAWVRAPLPRSQSTRDELAMKIAISATMPGVDAASVIAEQRRVSRRWAAQLRSAQYPGVDAEGPEALAWSLVNEAAAFHAEAELRWLDHVEERLAQSAARDIVMEREVAKPKRGRPAKVTDGYGDPSRSVARR